MERNFKFRSLGYQDLSQAKQFEEWAESNDVRVVSNLIQQGNMSVFLIMNEGTPVGVFNVSYRVTLLGKTLLPNAVHVYGLTLIEGDKSRVIRVLCRSMREILPRSYDNVVVSCSACDGSLLYALKSSGINQTIGNVTCLDTDGEADDIVILCANIGQLACEAKYDWYEEDSCAHWAGWGPYSLL